LVITRLSSPVLLSCHASIKATVAFRWNSAVEISPRSGLVTQEALEAPF
jgi:hypothetical protein